MNELLLNWLPPADIYSPSPPLSILKGFLQSKGFNVKIHYWNIVLFEYINKFLRLNSKFLKDDTYYISPFLNYIVLKFNDKETFEKLKNTYQSMFPHLINVENFSFDNYLKENARILEEKIITELEKLSIKDCKLFGVSAKLFQLIPANILSEIVKTVYPEVKIVIGGIGTKEEAWAIMKNFTFYDYAIWGEGEYPLLFLFQSILTNDTENIKNIPFLIHRAEASLYVSSNVQKSFFDLNSNILPDYSDFFEQIQHKNVSSQLRIPVEKSRGCHWQKCKFCFLNDGYRYRIKNIEKVIEEIDKQIKLFKIKKITFLDNDIIGKDIIMFENLLDALILFRKKYEDFEIVMAEIISKGLNSDIIKKMSLAGFSVVQLGYESSSDSLLKKISKKNSFASNLLFMKWAKKYSIYVDGLNILRGLLEETDSDIRECMENLHFLRFYRKYMGFIISTTTIGSSSKYYQEIEKTNSLDEWCVNPQTELLPNSYFAQIDRFKLFFYTKKNHNKLWALYEEIDKYYEASNYEYMLIPHDKTIYYYEILNNIRIHKIEFDNPIYWEILKECNSSVKSLSNLISSLNEKSIKINNDELTTMLLELRKKHLLYSNSDFSEIVTVINTDG